MGDAKQVTDLVTDTPENNLEKPTVPKPAQKPNEKQPSVMAGPAAASSGGASKAASATHTESVTAAFSILPIIVACQDGDFPGLDNLAKDVVAAIKSMKVSAKGWRKFLPVWVKKAKVCQRGVSS